MVKSGVLPAVARLQQMRGDQGTRQTELLCKVWGIRRFPSFIHRSTKQQNEITLKRWKAAVGTRGEGAEKNCTRGQFGSSDSGCGCHDGSIRVADE